MPWDELDEATGVGIEIEQVDEQEYDRIQEMYDGNVDISDALNSEFDAAPEKPNQFSCVAHRLQLVLKDVFEKDEEMIQLRKVIYI